MFIVCQNCHQLYDVPEDLIHGAQTTFKCSSCGAVFTSFLLEGVENKEIIDDNEETVLPVISSQSKPVETKKTSPISENTETFLQEEPHTEILHQNGLDKESVDSLLKQKRPLSDDSLSDNPLMEDVLSDSKQEVFAPVAVSKELMSSKKGALLVFIACFVILVMVAMYLGRFYLSRQSPFFKNIFESAYISTDVAGMGLEFQNIIHDVVNDKGQDWLFIKGNVVNTMPEIRDLPFVEIVIYEKENRILQRRHITLGKEKIEAGEILPFETKIKSAKLENNRVEMTFKRVVK